MKRLLLLLNIVLFIPNISIAQNILTPRGDDQTFSNIIINVIDDKTNERIKNAKVYVPNIPSYGNITGEKGQANFNVSNGQSEYLIFVEVDGYRSYSNTIVINENSNAYEYDFKLTPIVDAYDLRVKIIDKETGEYIEDAKVELIGKNTIPPMRDGEIVIFKNVPIGKSHIVKVEHEEYKTFFTPSPDNIEDEEEITINAPIEMDHFPVEIIVRNNGRPLRNASVNFLGFKGEEFITKTNGNGIASFPSIEKGFKQIEISKSNFHTQIKPITIAKKIPPEINQFSYSLQEIAAPDSLIIEGRIVIEGTNTGLENAAVRFKDNHGIHSYFTNKNGDFEMTKKIAYEDLAEFSFFLNVEHKDYRTCSIKEQKVSHLEFLRNRKIVNIELPNSCKKVTEVPLKLSHPVFNEKYIKDCQYKVKGKWVIGDCELRTEGETVYLVLKAPDFWEEVLIKICTPKKMFGKTIKRKEIEKKGNKNYKIELYKNRKGKNCNSDD